MRIDEAYTRLNIVRDYIPAGNSNRPGSRLTPTRITIHNTDNDQSGANAAAHARYQKGTDARARKVSWHFTVDDGPVYQSLPTNEVGWHAGSRAGNTSSIGIEICMNPEMDPQISYDTAALLAAVLAFQLGIPVLDGIVQHHHWSGKNCPRVLRDRAGAWDAFLGKVADYFRDLQDVSAHELAPVGDDHMSGGGDEPGENPAADRFLVIARNGLRVRSGPGVEFDVVSDLMSGSRVSILTRTGDWAQIDSEGDGKSDGYVHASFLRAE